MMKLKTINKSYCRLCRCIFISSRQSATRGCLPVPRIGRQIKNVFSQFLNKACTITNCTDYSFLSFTFSSHCTHTSSIAFRHLPPNSARFGYTTEGTLFISVQLSSDAVSALQKVWVLINSNMTVEAT